MAKAKTKSRTKLRKPKRRVVASQGLIIRSVQDYIDLVWMAGSNGTTAIELSARAGICYGTAAKHLAGDITTPHMRTAVSILQALGYKIKVGSS